MMHGCTRSPSGIAASCLLERVVPFSWITR
jgi:hypothetical protein